MTKFLGATMGHPSIDSSKIHKFLKTQATNMTFSGYLMKTGMTKFLGATMGHPSIDSSKIHKFLKTQATNMTISGYLMKKNHKLWDPMIWKT